MIRHLSELIRKIFCLIIATYIVNLTFCLIWTSLASHRPSDRISDFLSVEGQDRIARLIRDENVRDNMTGIDDPTAYDLIHAVHTEVTKLVDYQDNANHLEDVEEGHANCAAYSGCVIAKLMHMARTDYVVRKCLQDIRWSSGAAGNDSIPHAWISFIEDGRLYHYETTIDGYRPDGSEKEYGRMRLVRDKGYYPIRQASIDTHLRWTMHTDWKNVFWPALRYSFTPLLIMILFAISLAWTSWTTDHTMTLKIISFLAMFAAMMCSLPTDMIRMLLGIFLIILPIRWSLVSTRQDFFTAALASFTLHLILLYEIALQIIFRIARSQGNEMYFAVVLAVAFTLQYMIGRPVVSYALAIAHRFWRTLEASQGKEVTDAHHIDATETKAQE